MAPGTIIPVLAYPDVATAAAWLCAAFGFRERLRIGNHRVQLVFGDAAVIATQAPAAPGSAAGPMHTILVRVPDARRHHEQAIVAGAMILAPPTDFPYGERQYSAQDPGGHQWTFSQSIRDVDPASWGGELVPEPPPAG